MVKAPPAAAAPAAKPGLPPTVAAPTPAAAPTPKGTIYDDLVTPPKTPDTPAPTKPKGMYDDLLPTPKTDTPSPYFSAVDDKGNSFGFSDEKDASGKPFFAFRAPGDKATTTDKTRVATKFDPRIAAPQDRASFMNERAVANRADLKKQMGGDYSTELDHKIALELSGSNDVSNLQIEPGLKGGTASAHDQFETSLAKDVVAGHLSLFEAQSELAKAKGLAAPFSGAEVPFKANPPKPEPKTLLNAASGKPGSQKALDGTIAESTKSNLIPKPPKTTPLPITLQSSKNPADFNKEYDAISGNITSLTDEGKKIDALARELKKTPTSASSPADIAAYNTKVKALNEKITAHEAEVKSLQSRIALYESSAKEYQKWKSAEDYKAAGGQILQALDPDNEPYHSPGYGEVKSSGELNKNDINIKIPFTPDSFVSMPSPFNDKRAFGGQSDNLLNKAANFAANIPSAVLQAPTRAAVTLKEEFSPDSLAGEKNKTLSPTEAALYGSPTYKNTYADIQDRIRNGDGVLSAYIGGISSKTLDVAVGAQVFSQGLRASARLLASDSPYSTIEAWRTLGSPKNAEEQALNYRQLSHQLHPDTGGSTEAQKVLNQANDILNKQGVPSTLKLYEQKGAQYAEWASRETKLGDPIFTLNTDIKTGINAKPLGLKALPGYKEMYPKPFAAGLSTEPVEPVGFGQKATPEEALHEVDNHLTSAKQVVDNVPTGPSTVPFSMIKPEVRYDKLGLEPAAIDPHEVADPALVAAYKAGEPVPAIPVEMTADGKYHLLGDGGTRYVAARAAGVTNIEVDIKGVNTSDILKSTQKDVVGSLEAAGLDASKVKALKPADYASLDEFSKAIKAATPTAAEAKMTNYSPASKKTAGLFDMAGGQKLVATRAGVSYELGQFGQNHDIRKSAEDKGDRFPASELPQTIDHITATYKASLNLKSYRSDNLANVATMPDGTTRVVYTRVNGKGAQEIIGWHAVSDPKFIETLKQNGTPGENRTPNAVVRTDGLVPSNGDMSHTIPETTANGKQSFKTAAATEYDLAEAAADKAMRQLFSPSEVDLAFRKNLVSPSGTPLLGRTRPSPDSFFTPQFKTIIDLVTKGGKVSSTTLFHEAFHVYFNNFLTDAERNQYLSRVRKNLATLPHRALNAFDPEYKDPNVRAEEWLADDFAQYIKDKNTSDIVLRSFYEHALFRIRSWIRKAEAFTELYDRILAKDRSSEGSEKATPERFKTGGEKAPTENEQKLTDLKAQKSALEEALANNPAKNLAKYVNGKTGELPEALGTGRSKFGKVGDELAADLGFASSEDARLQYQNYKLQQKRLEGLKKEIAGVWQEVQKGKLEDKDAKSLGSFLDKQGSRTEAELAVEQTKNRIRKAELESAAKLTSAKDFEAHKKQMLEETQRNAATKENIVQKFNRALKPLKSEDAVVQKIYKRWRADVVVGKELAELELKKLPGAEKNDMEAIHAYQAGVKSPYNTQVKNLFDGLFSEGARRGLDVGYRDNYLPQVYGNSTDEVMAAAQKYLKDLGLGDNLIGDYLDGKTLPQDAVKALKISPTFERTRLFPDYKTAMHYGLTPKYQNIPALAAYYREQLERSIAGQEFIKNLYKNGKTAPVDGYEPREWQALDIPFSPMRYVAPPRLAQLINNLFYNEDTIPFSQAFFHGFATLAKTTQEIALSAGIPFTNVNFFSMGQSISSLTKALGAVFFNPKITASELKNAWTFVRANFNGASIKFFEKNAEYIRMMGEQGIDLGGRVGTYSKLYSTIARSGFISKAVGASSHFWHEAFNAKTFGNMMPQMYIQTFKDTYTAAIAKGLNPSQAQRLAGDTTKAAFGLLDDVARPQKTQDVLSSIFFAPKFRESLIGIYLNAAKGSSTKFFDPAFSRNRALLLGMILTLAGYEYLNQKLNDGKPLWENEPGHEFDIKIPVPGRDDIIYVPFMPSTFAFIRNIFEGTAAFGKGDTKTGQQKYGSLFSQPIKDVFDVLANKNYFGQPIYKDTDTAAQKTAKIAAYIGVATSHPYIKEIVSQIQNKKPLYQSISNALELPLSFSSQSKILQNQFYNAIADQAKVKARALDAFKPTYEEIKNLKDAGRTDEAQKLVDTLSDADYAIYKTMKASDTRAATIKNQKSMVDTVNQVQKLKASGDTAGAQKLVDDLSDAEYKTYQSTKKKMGIQ